MREIVVKVQGSSASEIGLSESDIKQEVKDAVLLAAKIASIGTARLGRVLLNRRRRIRERTWNEDAMIKRFFGDRPPSNGQMRKVDRRMSRVYKRLTSVRLVIRVRPQPSGSPGRRAQNLGWIFSPRRFKIYPAWFGTLTAEYKGNSGENSSNSDLRRAAILIHELNHDLFGDQKLDGDKVYGEEGALDLADAKPRRARRSAENLEWFCMRLKDPAGKL